MRVVAAVCLMTLVACKARESSSQWKSLTGEGGAYELKTTDASVLKAIDAQEKRRPVVIYYAVNQNEPYMQLFVDLELLQLRRACTAPEPTDFIAIVNSHIADAPEAFYMVCHHGVLELKKGPSFRSAAAAHPGLLNYRTPLAFMLISGEIYMNEFPPDQYIYFFHFKSHGSEHLTLAGLHDDALKAKTETQITRLKAKGLLKEGQESLLPPGTEGLVSADLGRNTELHLNSSAAELALARGLLGDHNDALGDSNSVLGDSHEALGDSNPFLGDANSFLGDTNSALGIGPVAIGVNALFAQHAEGLKADQFLTSVQWFIGSKWNVGFMMIEACSTKMDGQRFIDFSRTHAPIDAYYSAVGSLWYHNLNWAKLTAGGVTAAELQKRLIDATKTIPNLVRKAGS